MDIVKSLVQPLLGSGASNSMIDGVKLVVLGGTVETARRMSSSAWYGATVVTRIIDWLANVALPSHRSSFVNCMLYLPTVASS